MTIDFKVMPLRKSIKIYKFIENVIEEIGKNLGVFCYYF